MDWADQAACKGRDADFFPFTWHQALPAMEICRGCPVKSECLNHALTHGESYGVWGGILFGGKSSRHQKIRLMKQYAARGESGCSDGFL